MFQLYFTQRIIDEVSSYCITDWKDLTYQQILSTLQFLYMPLNLSLFQSLVLAYRVEVNESFLEFSSRTYRHLKLCSRLKAPNERADYIERNRVAILKQNVPTHVLDIIVKKEQLFKPYNSQEIIDHVISQYHTKSNNKTEEIKQYHVFNIGQSSSTGKYKRDIFPKNKTEPFKQFSNPTRSLINRPESKNKFSYYSRNNREQGNIRSGNVNTKQMGKNKNNFEKKKKIKQLAQR